MDQEMRFHLEMEVEANLRRGMPLRQARREALLRFGGVERFKERARDERGGRVLDDLSQDLRFTLRKLRRSPGFALVVLLTLALGIGANTAIFTLVDSILLRPLPFPAPDRLVRVYQTAPERGAFRGTLSLPDGRDLGERSRMVSALGMYSALPSGLIFTGGDQPRELATAYVSGGFFPALAVSALYGRTLLPEEEEGDNHVVVLSHAFWLQEAGGDPSVVGTTLDMEGIAFRVVGIMPPDFAFPDPDVEIWTFLTVIDPSSIPLQLRPVRILNALARLAPGVGLEEAQAELSAIAQRIQEEFAEGRTPEVVGASLVPLQEAMVGDARLALVVLLGAVGLILLIACANVANLLLARGIGRGQEMALRAALGAGRSRLAMQLLTESVLLGLVGGGTGLVFALLGVEAFVARGGELLPRTWEVGIRWEVLFFTLGISLLTGLVFGLLPAATAARTDPSQGLRRGPLRGSTAGGQQRVRQTLVVAQVAVAVVLLVGAGLMTRSLVSLQNVDPGFRAEGLLGVTVSLSDVLFREREEYMGAYHTLLERYRTLPGVEGAASIRYLPMRGSGEQVTYTVVGRAPPPRGQEPTAWTLQVSQDLFQVMGIPLLAGRSFSPDDRAEPPLVTVVNETLAREAFNGEDPVGQRLAFWGYEAEVVGVVGDVHQEGLRESPLPTAYIHQEQVARSAMTFVLRTAGRPLQMAGPARQVVAELEPNQAITAIESVEEVVHGSTARARFITLLLGSFAILAFVLAALGIYGVVAYLVARQLHEIGIRLALGARPSEAMGLVLRRGLAPVVLGLVLGVALSLPLTRPLGGLLFQVGAGDPASYLSGASLLLAAALVATLVPACRALRANPGSLLGQE
jgi:predicted permease